MDVKTRAVPERTLAVIGKELLQPELEEFIVASFDALFAYAGRHQGVRPLDTTPEWPTYVIFHGEVSPTEQALVEVCVVVTADAPAEGDIAIKVEPAHEVAFVEISKAGLDYPAILEAYDAAAAWVAANAHLHPELPSREAYMTDVMAAGASDHVCDVAFPYVKAGS